MSPILKGVVASGISGHLTPAASLSYESIASATPSGTGTVTFSSIPSTFKHLQIRTNIFQGTGSDIFFKVNSTQGYGSHYIVSTGGATLGGGSDLSPGANGAYFGNTGANASGAQVGITDILDYTSTSKNKVVRSIGGLEYNSNSTSGRVWFYSYLFDTTAAITSITFYSGNSYTSGSSFALYGIKG